MYVCMYVCMYVAPDKFIFSQIVLTFFLFLHEKVCCGGCCEKVRRALWGASHQCTHNICFHGEIRKIFDWYTLLSRGMNYMDNMRSSVRKKKTISNSENREDSGHTVCKYGLAESSLFHHNRFWSFQNLYSEHQRPWPVCSNVQQVRFSAFHTWKYLFSHIASL